MDFRLSDDQRLLDDSASKYLAGQYSFDLYRKQLSDGIAFDSSRWSAMAELGWMALPFPESVGGFGGSLVDIQLIARRLGERLCTDPWLTCAILPGKLLEFVGTDSAKRLLADIAAGTARGAMAALETNGHYDPGLIATRVTESGDGIRLHGIKSVVFGAEYAHVLLVTARAQNGEAMLVAVPSTADGLTLNNYRVVDGSRASEVVLSGVRLPASAVLARGRVVIDAVKRAMDVANAAICADLLGAASAMLKRTQEYARTRKQFGVTIGSFQVIQHYLVDMFIETQQSESLVWMAGILGDTPDCADREQAISTAKAYISRSAVLVAQKSVQIHGGIGVTEELDIGHYFRRVTHHAQLFGDRDHHVQRYMACQQRDGKC